MGHRRQSLSFTLAALSVSLAVALACGCGSSSETTGTSSSGLGAPASPAGARVQSCAAAVANLGPARVTGVGCPLGREIADAWHAHKACAPAGGSSRAVCTVGGYRCLAAATDRGVVVNCARPGRSISFLARHG
ncbi:MAG: hypothetical protein ACRDLL_08375 [Solirubrobacterales bacterium]